jgi:acetyltransferase EpsM
MESQSIFAVQAPLVNPNEPIALLVTLYVKEGQKISRGDLICTLETTKSVLDMAAERDGFIVGLQFKGGENVEAGETLCYISPSPDVKPEPTALSKKEPKGLSDEGLPGGLRITQPALALAREFSLDLSLLPTGVLVTEAVVRNLLDELSLTKIPSSTQPTDPHAIIIYGSGGHGKTLVDLMRLTNAFNIVGFIDDGRQKGDRVMGIPVLGGTQELTELANSGIRQAVNAVGGIGNIQSRIQVFKRLKQAGFSFPTLVHPTAFVEPSAELSPGVQVFAHAYVGTQAKLGLGVIVNTGAIVSHDCQIANYANISPGAMLAGQVNIGEGTLVGMGATINLQVKIGDWVRIGNGATVKNDVPDSGIVRAGAVWPEK